LSRETDPLDESPFRNQFARVAADYVRFRPRYPRALFQWIAAQAPRHDLAWDCATGNGQAAVGLAQDFRRVLATDASEEQLAHALPHAHVAYRPAPADDSGLVDGAADVVTVAQALHWLPRERFYQEARRVLRPGGLLAAWGYHLPGIGVAAVDATIRHFHQEVIGPYWRPESQLVVNRFQTIDFPFAELSPPAFEIHQPMTLAALGDFLRTQSATEHYRRARGDDPVVEFEARVAALWGGMERVHDVVWPIFMRAGHAH
jgi:SAM-dependent methyltransferase